jgi:curved DNA-binding protein CbpA
LEEHDLYKVLGLKSGATLDEIKDAYRVLAKRYHPDLNKGKRAGEEFSRVASAYKMLTVREREKAHRLPGEGQGTLRHKGFPDADISSYGEMLLSAKTPDMRAFAARRLKTSGKRSAYAFLRKGLYDSSELVVISCVDAIGALKVHQSAGELSGAFARGGKAVKLSVLEAVRSISLSGGFKNILLLAMQDADSQVCALARALFTRAGR